MHSAASCEVSEVDQTDRNGAFTLLDLLVVIAIIALLAALLLPALNRPKSERPGPSGSDLIGRETKT